LTERKTWPVLSLFSLPDEESSGGEKKREQNLLENR
jgi:hypothetical protein